MVSQYVYHQHNLNEKFLYNNSYILLTIRFTLLSKTKIQHFSEPSQ